MIFPRLLAKSSSTPDAPRDAETLVGHLSAVTGVAVALSERWGERYLLSLGLEPAIFAPQLAVGLPRAALAHDWAKANDHFQRMVRGDRTLAHQAAWHEHLAVWLALCCKPLHAWLFDGCHDSLRFAVLVAILGHHLRVEDGTDVGIREGSGARHLVMLTGHPDFSRALTDGAARLNLASPPIQKNVVIDLLESESFDDAMGGWLCQVQAWWRAAAPEECRFVAALKALLVASDVVGSAIPRMPDDPVAWTERVLSNVSTPMDLEQIVTRRLRGGRPRLFQEAVRQSTARVTFVRAGCGSGKTAAAYLWAAKRTIGRKLFFCYPTTGTASQGFADYVPTDEFDAALVHSRAPADLEALLTTGLADDQDQLDWLTRYAALVAWDAPVTVCTVDTVLGLMQNNRAGLFSFPSIANGAFVFDEIHQYDDRLFGSLLRFLDTFRGVPSLLMTASLPRSHLVAIEELLARLGQRLHVVEGPRELEILPRYCIERTQAEQVWDRVASSVRRGQRVLWVANTVDRAMRTTRQADALALRVLPYHSRYRYQERLRRHQDVVGAFAGQSAGGVLAVTTQVCEVSLDLSADLLVTDLAPVPALIQRLGRLNRRAMPEVPVETAAALMLEPPFAEPYTADDLSRAGRWLEVLGAGALSQADLAAAFDHLFGDASVSPSVCSAWLDGGMLSGRAALREEGTTIPVVRAEDVGELAVRPASLRCRRLIRLTIPMPLRPVVSELGSCRRMDGVLVAPAGSMHYDERLGGQWQ